ncbi:VaFE repeat-containing surface-anchored protein [Dorea longicatena]|uniref:VaFE repeat-containing surface-anchored protein n=1 Tax=Dorea longicatena TaxID=88431 RepID=UPI00156EBD12|nr:VaFE repeat-containing surface-anchored protein [Dorea longicatena]
MKRKKWVNKVIALLLAAIMIVPSSLGTVAYAQEPEVSSEQTQTIQNADEDISEANEQETADASQKEQEKKETQETQDTESKETQKEDSYEVKLSKADNGLLSFPISEDDLVKADVENSTQSILDASEEDVEYESKDSYEENAEVKVQTSADYGYELDKVELEDKSGEVLQELSVDEEGIATFTMPEENVKVAATFKEIPESVIEDAEIDLQTTASDYEIATRAAGTKSIYLNVPGNKIWYGRYNTRYYTTNEGQVAYCMNPLLKTPGAGWYTGSLISDGSSRKAFYYAYGGPGYSQFVNRYGWIWNGVRDLEYAYSHVILSYTYAKYALHNNSQANYAFYGLPNSTKKHLINKANQMQAMGGIPSGYAVYYFNTSYNHQPMAFQVNNVATLSLRKSSSNTDITNGNSCYSLANAKYGVYSNAACTSQVSTFTTNANGTSNSINLEPGTYYVKEISAPEGYYIDNTVKTVSLSSGENKVVSFTDKPMDDPAAIVIQKKDKYTGNTIKGKKTLAGAQFTIKYYDGFYDRNSLPARATRTWVIETKERTKSNGSKVYQAGLSDTYKVGGDNFYKVDGAITIPRGTITIQETKAPDGYRNDLNMTDTKGNSTVNGVYLAQVTKPGDLSTLMGGQTFEGSDSPVRADIKLTKINGTNNNTMANIPFKITNLETKESHTIYTGSNGVYDSSLIKKSLNTNTDKAGAGVWFGDTSILNDDEGSFEYGSYSIEELECKENNGKILYKGTFKIDNNTGATLDLGKIINNSIEVKTYAADNTSGNNNTAFIQQGGIFNYTTGQLTYGKAITDEVNVKGISSGYAVANLVDIETGEYIKNKDGSLVQSEAKIEPYNDGTYTGQAHQNLIYDNPESMLGKNIVVFEKIYALNADGTPNYNKLLVEHTDMNDDLQTVKFQKISTELTVSDTGLHEVNTTSKDVTLQDQITYENFSKDLVDLGYYIKANAKLVDENGNAITDANGNAITSGFSAKRFTSDMLKNGDAIHYTLPASVVKKYAGKKLISQVEIYFAFDTDTTNGDPWNLWTYEKDTTNEKQTVTIPAITNTYVSADNVSYTDTGISDQVNLTGLTRGNTYTLVGKIIDKSTGKVVSKSRKCTYGKDAYDITNVVPADEGNYTVNRLDTYNVYLLKKDVSSSGETAKQGYYRLNDEGTKYVLCTESGQVLDDSNGIKKDLFENEILYPGDEFKEVTELIAKKSFVPSGSESQQHVDFTFDPEELAGKNYVITQDLYFDKLQDAGTVFDDETADVYAVLYSDGTLSFQKRKDTYPSKTVVEVYPFNESTHFPTIDSVLWKNNALNVKSVEFRDKIRPVSTARWFNGFENATSINLKNLDTSRDTNMNKMFSYCKGLTKLDVSGLDTSQVTDMDAMFAVCINLTNIPVSNFNTSKVKDMHSMFDSCFKLQSLDLSMFDTSNVTDFGYMFSGDKVMSTLHLTDNFVTEKAKDISGIFNDCEKLSNINVSNWNVSNVTSTEKAFANNFLLKSLDLSNWDMSNCENSQMMFYSDTALTSIGNTSNWNVSKITTTHSMFEGCSKLQSLNTSKWVFSNLTNADSMFSNCQVLTKLDTSNWGMGKVIYFGFLFNNCYALTSLNVSKWDTSNANIFNAMFNECVNLTNIDVSNWKTSNVTQAVNTFLDCKKLTQVAVQNWDMSNVSQLSGMFAYCSGITSLDISKWNAPKLIEINNTFNGLTKCTSIKIKGMYAPNIDTCINTFLDCTSLTSLDLSGLGMSKATSFNGMFGRMSNITSINLSGWSTSNVTDTTNMFTECRKLKTIYVSEGWSVAKVKSDTYMFSSCTSIRGGSGKTYNRNQLGKSMANYSNGYLTYKAYTAKANIAAPSSSVIISSAKATDGLTVEEILNNDSVFTDPIRAVNEENTGTENEDVDTQNADVAVQSMDDPSGKLLYSHSDLNDENETFYVPKVQTVLTNTANDHYFTTAAGSTLVDTVTYSGLKPGHAYTLTGKLMDKDTGKAATDKSGKEITGTATFTPSTANGTAKVNFSFDGSNLKGKTLVAYETLNGISVAYGIASSKKDLAIHKDISDADQSVTNMSLSTTAKDQKSGTKQVTLSRTAKIDDTVSYKGAIRGTSYKINGTLMNKSTGEAAVDGDGKPITASGVFTAGSATGTATVTFTFNTNGMAGGAYVAFEEVYETTGGKETLWGTHMDLNDEAQTVYVPSISTNLIDEDSQTNYTYIRDNVKAHDLVTYEGLIAGKTYKLTGTLVEKSTGKTFVDANGKTATITQTFTPDSDSGSVDMVFDINPSNLKTSALVAFETLSCNGEQVTIENDLDNEQQTLHFPILSTTAKGKVSGKNYVDIGGDMSIIDTIKYEGVQYGMTHTIKSYLVDKTTGKIVQDDNGNDIVKTTEWEPEATQGSIDVEIPVTGKKLAGRTLVVFEEIYLGDAMIACHKDINDANQTIKVKGYRDCTVIKRIKADDYWKEHGDPTFIFKLTGTDTLGAAHTYYQSVTFTENYVKAHTDSDGYVEMKAVFGQVPAGEYTCSEESVSRFEFESLTKPVNATINGKTAVYHLTDNDTACATFTNKKYEEGDFGHDSVVVNHFNHKTQD